jgi:hypothetical protein
LKKNISLLYNKCKMNHIINFELDGENTSQTLIDRYSFSHITHGVLFYFIFENISFTKKHSLIFTIIFELLWEWFENTPYTINKYRKNPEYNDYIGDSIINVMGDVIFTIIGFYIAKQFPFASILLIVVLEIILWPFKANFLKIMKSGVF